MRRRNEIFHTIQSATEWYAITNGKQAANFEQNNLKNSREIFAQNRATAMLWEIMLSPSVSKGNVLVMVSTKHSMVRD